MKLFRTGSPGSPAGLIASAVGKAVQMAVIGGAMLAGGAAGAGAAGAGGAGGAAKGSSAAQNAMKAAKGNSSGSAVEDTGKAIDKNMDA